MFVVVHKVGLSRHVRDLLERAPSSSCSSKSEFCEGLLVKQL